MFTSIFVPTQAQFDDLANDKTSLKTTLENKFPFVSVYKQQLQNANTGVSQNDFLDITIPSFSFSGGSINVQTQSINVNNFGERYEPYRQTIRSSLLWIAVACAVVFLVKHILFSISPSSFETKGKVGGGGNE